ncbi:MAG: hypothetical protein ACT4O2_12700 [Beijerinckiaceae bacterium]
MPSLPRQGHDGRDGHAAALRKDMMVLTVMPPIKKITSRRAAKAGVVKFRPKEKNRRSGSKRIIEISGSRSGELFEFELRQIRYALRDTPFVAAAGGLCLALAEMDWSIHGMSGFVATKLSRAKAGDLIKELRKRVRVSRPSTVLQNHLPELMERARRSPRANICSVWLRLDSNGCIVSSSPSLYFGQSRPFGNL